MNCPNCGSSVPPGLARCRKCGSFVEQPAQPTQGATPVVQQPIIIQTVQAAPVAGTKSRVAAGILGILLGYLGVHRFYMGYIGVGIVQLILTLTFVGMFISGPWGFTEGVLILVGAFNRDAKGQPLV